MACCRKASCFQNTAVSHHPGYTVEGETEAWSNWGDLEVWKDASGLVMSHYSNGRRRFCRMVTVNLDKLKVVLLDLILVISINSVLKNPMQSLRSQESTFYRELISTHFIVSLLFSIILFIISSLAPKLDIFMKLSGILLYTLLIFSIINLMQSYSMTIGALIMQSKEDIKHLIKIFNFHRTKASEDSLNEFFREFRCCGLVGLSDFRFNLIFKDNKYYFKVPRSCCISFLSECDTLVPENFFTDPDNQSDHYILRSCNQRFTSIAQEFGETCSIITLISCFYFALRMLIHPIAIDKKEFEDAIAKLYVISTGMGRNKAERNRMISDLKCLFIDKDLDTSPFAKQLFAILLTYNNKK